MTPTQHLGGEDFWYKWISPSLEPMPHEFGGWREGALFIHIKCSISTFLFNMGLSHTCFSTLKNHICFSQHSPSNLSLSTMLIPSSGNSFIHIHVYLRWHFYQWTCLPPTTIWGGIFIQVSQFFTRTNGSWYHYWVINLRVNVRGHFSLLILLFYEQHTLWETHHILTQNLKHIGGWVLSLIDAQGSIF